jgi:hypothetical protein
MYFSERQSEDSHRRRSIYLDDVYIREAGTPVGDAEPPNNGASSF